MTTQIGDVKALCRASARIIIPVIACVWNYAGLDAEQMEQRIIGVHERVLTTTVNNIEHSEAQAVRGISIVKIFLQPGAKIDGAVAQTTAGAQATGANANRVGNGAQG